MINFCRSTCDWVRKFFFTTPHFAFAVWKSGINFYKTKVVINHINSIFLKHTFCMYCVLHHTLNIYVNSCNLQVAKATVYFISFGSFTYRINFLKFSEFFKPTNLSSLIFLKTLVFMVFFRDFAFYTTPFNKFYPQIQKFEPILPILICSFLKKKFFFIFMSNSNNLVVWPQWCFHRTSLIDLVNFKKNNPCIYKTYFSTYNFLQKFIIFSKKKYFFFIKNYNECCNKIIYLPIITNSSNFIKFFFKTNFLILFVRKQKCFNKGRYARNRQLYRTGVYWCLYINIIALLGLNYIFYKFTINFMLYWWLFFITLNFFILPQFIKNKLFLFNKIIDIYLFGKGIFVIFYGNIFFLKKKYKKIFFFENFFL